ncbi:MAG TPA: DUF2829 domain-containing protein [Fimbriimonadaceae bacterium]|nr:DUF2829 domain-containing protein [Fimbriimonadaceae bacterium]
MAVTQDKDLTFGQALNYLKQGRLVTREGWNGKGQHLGLQTPDPDSKMSRPYIYIKTVDHALVPWVASQSDLLADDWQTVGASMGWTETSANEDTICEKTEAALEPGGVFISIEGFASPLVTVDRRTP